MISRTSFELAPVLLPITPFATLVSEALLASTNSVRDPFVPTVTSPLKLFVTLLSVTVVPSETSWAVNALGLRRKKKVIAKKDNRDGTERGNGLFMG